MQKNNTQLNATSGFAYTQKIIWLTIQAEMMYIIIIMSNLKSLI